MKKALLLVAALIVLGAPGFVAYDFWHTHAEISAAQRDLDANARRLLPLYLKKSSAVARMPFFASPRPALEAGPFLNPKIAWGDGRGARGALRLDPALEDAIERWGGDGWLERADDPRVQAADISWMAELPRYGFWSLVSGGDTASVERPSPGTVPLPNFIPLLEWAKVRLLRGRRDGNLGEASREVEALAFLCYSTETFIGEAVSVAMLRTERRAYDTFSKEGVSVSGWAPPTEEQLDDFYSVIFGADAYANVLVPAELRKKALGPAIGRCAAISESSLVDISLRRALKVPVPSWMRRMLQSPPPPCRLDVARELLSRDRGQDSIELAIQEHRRATLLERLRLRLEPETSVALLETLAIPKAAFDHLEHGDPK